MSSAKTWLTNEEVLRGLSEGYVLIGNAPPPIRYEAEDEEILEQFGEELQAAKSIQNVNAPPDLRGITSLLRMVQGPDENDNENLASGKQPNCVIKISKPNKLNPNVKEFVPRGLSSNSSSDLSKSDSPVYKTDVKKVKTNADKLCNREKEIDKEKPSVDEKVQKLKNEIADSSESDSFEDKKRKNVAITTLLRLYATNNNKVKSPKKSEPIKLITPDFYEYRCSESPTANNEENVEMQSTSTSTDKTGSGDPVLSVTPVRSESASCTQDDEGNATKSPQNNIDNDMKKSIDKVNQWLSDPVTKKSSTLCLGPIAFKKKDSTTSKSPSICESETKKTAHPVQPNRYQPSNYAADLGRKYMEKKKLKEARRDMWADLDLILKEKDEKIRQCQDQASTRTINDDIEAAQ